MKVYILTEDSTFNYQTSIVAVSTSKEKIKERLNKEKEPFIKAEEWNIEFDNEDRFTFCNQDGDFYRLEIEEYETI